MTPHHPERPLRLTKAAKILRIPVHVARSRRIPLVYAELQQLLSSPPSWLTEAQAERRAISKASKERREKAAAAQREAVEKALSVAVESHKRVHPGIEGDEERFAFLILDGAILSLLGQFPEGDLDAAAFRLYPEAADYLFGGDTDFYY